MRFALAAILLGASFAVALGYGAILPLLPTLLERVAAAPGASGLHSGGLTGIYMLALFLSAVPWGRAADRFGPRAVLVGGLAGYAAALVAVAAARDLASAYLLRAVAGAFAGAVLPVVALLVAEVREPEARARLFAATVAASLLGLLLGPALSGGASLLMLRMQGAAGMDAGTIAWALAASGASAVVTALAALGSRAMVRRPAAQEPARGPLQVSAGGHLRAAYAANFLVLFGLGAFEAILPPLGESKFQLGTAGLAFLFAQCSLVMIAVQGLLFYRPVLTRVPGGAVVAGGFATMAAGAAWLALGGTLASQYWGVGLIAAGSGWLLPAIGYLATADERDTSGAMLGALTAAGSLGQAIGSAAGGWLFDRAAGGAFWIVAAATGAGIVLAAGRQFARRPRAGAAQVPAGRGTETAVQTGRTQSWRQR